MGKPTWDPRTGIDARLYYSSVIFKDAYAYFELHRDLRIPKRKVHWLATALTSREAFKARVPEFLASFFKKASASKAEVGSDFGLQEIVRLIASRQFLDETKWKFAIHPLPWDRKADEAKAYHFEIRLHLKYNVRALHRLSDKIRSNKAADDEFFDTIDALGEFHKAEAQFLLEVFPLKYRPKKSRR